MEVMIVLGLNLIGRNGWVTIYSMFLGFNSQADIPLQAIKKGNEGKSYTVGLNLQKNESQEAGQHIN
jgi:hypothetical protein